MAQELVTFSVDQKQMDALRETLGNISNQLRNVLAKSINQAARAGRVRAMTIIGQDSPIGPKMSGSRIDVIQASKSNLTGYVKFDATPFPLRFFKPVQSPTGVTARLGRLGTVSIPHAFMNAPKWNSRAAVMPNGYRGVFIRRSIGGRRVGRLPLDKIMGPNVIRILGRGGIDEVKDYIRDVLSAEASSRIAAILEKRGGT